MALVIALAFGTAACGEDRASIRIGVLSDCEGLVSFLYEPTLAAAVLPLLERGAKRLGDQPSAGIAGAKVAGRTIEVITGCAGTSSSSAVEEARRLVEHEGVKILVGPGLTEGSAVKDYAKTRPETAFVGTSVIAQSATLRDPAPNFFSFYLDETQVSAGLGSYAHRLGWRRAVIVADDHPATWGYTAGIVAEFCALGGEIVKRIWAPATANPSSVANEVPRQGLDGIFYVSSGGRILTSLLNKLPLLRGGLAGKVVGNGSPFVDPSIALGDRLVGAVYSTGGTNSSPTGPGADYVARLARAFPKIYSFTGLLAPTNGFGLGYHNAMQAVLAALERVDGDLSDGERRFMSELAKVELDAPNGHVRLDAHRQAIAPNYLNRLEKDSHGKLVARTFETVADVEQTFGGLFSPSSPPPGRDDPPCRRGKPPPWAR
ncbi:MAG: ABC transporter substrate-binding protein [Gaiellaceae bacterium]